MFAVFSPHISLPKIQGLLVFKFYIRYARSSLVHCEKENIGRIVSGGKQQHCMNAILELLQSTTSSLHGDVFLIFFHNRSGSFCWRREF